MKIFTGKTPLDKKNHYAKVSKSKAVTSVSDLLGKVNFPNPEHRMNIRQRAELQSAVPARRILISGRGKP